MTVESIPGPGTRLFVMLQHLLPQQFLSRLTGMAAHSRWPWLKNALIDLFINAFKVDLSEAIVQAPQDFQDFNAFFTRELRADARPLDTSAGAVLAPADGSVSQLGSLDGQQLLQAKGRQFSAAALLGDSDTAARYAGGNFMTVYLAPRDYHRVHMPCAGTLVTMRHIPGKLFSVNAGTATLVDQLFARNERVVCEFDGDKGPFAMVLVGAMVVASIETVWAGQVAPPGQRVQSWHYNYSETIHLAAGEEMGRFQLGSTVIILFPPDTLTWDPGLSAGSVQRMGTRVGSFR